MTARTHLSTSTVSIEHELLDEPLPLSGVRRTPMLRPTHHRDGVPVVPVLRRSPAPGADGLQVVVPCCYCAEEHTHGGSVSDGEDFGRRGAHCSRPLEDNLRGYYIDGRLVVPDSAYESGPYTGSAEVAPVWHEDPPRDPWCFQHGTEYQLQGAERCETCREVIAYAVVWLGWVGEHSGCRGPEECSHCEVCGLCGCAGQVCALCSRCPEHPHPVSGVPVAQGWSRQYEERFLALEQHSGQSDVRAGESWLDAGLRHLAEVSGASHECYVVPAAEARAERARIEAAWRDPRAGAQAIVDVEPPMVVHVPRFLDPDSGCVQDADDWGLRVLAVQGDL